MTQYMTAVVVVLLVALVLGLLRVVRGPTGADRMLSAQLFGTTGTAILLMWAAITGVPGMLDTALVVAALAPVTAVAFVHLCGRSQA